MIEIDIKEQCIENAKRAIDGCIDPSDSRYPILVERVAEAIRSEWSRWQPFTEADEDPTHGFGL